MLHSVESVINSIQVKFEKKVNIWFGRKYYNIENIKKIGSLERLTIDFFLVSTMP